MQSPAAQVRDCCMSYRSGIQTQLCSWLLTQNQSLETPSPGCSPLPQAASDLLCDLGQVTCFLCISGSLTVKQGNGPWLIPFWPWHFMVFSTRGFSFTEQCSFKQYARQNGKRGHRDCKCLLCQIMVLAASYHSCLTRGSYSPLKMTGHILFQRWLFESSNI